MSLSLQRLTPKARLRLLLVGGVSFTFSFPGQITWSDGKAVVAEADMEKLGVLAKFKISHNIKDLNAAGDGGADEELVSFGRELNALPDALGVHRVEQSRGLGCDVDHDDAVVIGPQRGGDGHFAVGVEGKTLGAIGHLLNDRVYHRLFPHQIGKKNV